MKFKIIIEKELFDGFVYIEKDKIVEVSKEDKPCDEFYDYTGKYIIGSETSWENVLNVSPERVNETGELSVGNKMPYEFLWQWPYEHGDDAFDTMLGNLAVDEDLTLTVEINVLATADEYADGGFATGDDTNINVTLMTTIGSFAMFICSINACFCISLFSLFQ